MLTAHCSQSTQLLELRDETIDILDLASTLSWWGLYFRVLLVTLYAEPHLRKKILVGQALIGHTGNLQRLQTSLILNTKVRQSLLLQRLLLCLHDVRQAGVPRLVQAQIRRNDHGQLRAEGLNTTVDFAGDFDGATVILDVDLAGLRRLRPVEETSQHLARLALVAVNGLLAQQDEIDVLLLHDALQQLRDSQRLQAAVVGLGHVDVEGSVGAQGHGRAEGVCSFGWARREREDVVDLQRALALADANGLFD